MLLRFGSELEGRRSGRYLMINASLRPLSSSMLRALVLDCLKLGESWARRGLGFGMQVDVPTAQTFGRPRRSQPATLSNLAD